MGIFGESTGHSVLAYGYERKDDEITVKIYDPNFPNDDSQKIVYNVDTEEFTTSGYSAGFLDKTLSTTGSGSFRFVRSYEDIFKDALGGFILTVSKLDISSPENGSETDEGTIYVTGTFDSLSAMGEQIGDYVELVSKDGQIFRSDLHHYGVDASQFTIEVPLKNGENYFLVNTLYKDEMGNEFFLSHNMFGWLEINSTVPSDAIYITLTWDSQPDVDLYVTNPYGETSWYSN